MLWGYQGRPVGSILTQCHQDRIVGPRHQEQLALGHPLTQFFCPVFIVFSLKLKVLIRNEKREAIKWILALARSKSVSNVNHLIKCLHVSNSYQHLLQLNI